MTASKITWTKVDEAPALASYALLPIIKAYTKDSGIEIEKSDISLVGRIIANFPDHLSDEQKIPDYLKQLGKLQMPISSNCRISARQFPSFKLQSKNYKKRDMISLTILKNPGMRLKNSYRQDLPGLSVLLSIRYFVKETPIGEQRLRSKSLRRNILIKWWGIGQRRDLKRVWPTWMVMISLKMRIPPQ